MISTIRHDSIFDKNTFNTPVHIIGAGATGSRVFAALVELGLTNITVHDFDDIEPHNLANQAYQHDDIGMPKVMGCARLYQDKTGENVPTGMELLNERVTGDTKLSGVVFLLTDTMSSRKEIFEGALLNNIDVEFLIETRMASSYGNVYAIDPCNEAQSAKWLETLSEDDDPSETSACGASISVGPTASIIANMAVWQFINFAENREAVDEETVVFLRPLVISAGKI
tara:strand:+ start:10233 stop:10913 length:681 start_codon:yes stop_codon:yes gene_type:complete